MELLVPAQYDPRFGSLDDLIAEIAACGSERVCISSEQFETAYNLQGGLARLRAAFAEVGYTTKVIVYLRPQADYLEALYAEIAKGGHFYEFETCLDEIITRGLLLGGVLFSYERLVDILASVFGWDSVIVRPYRRSAGLDTIVREFAAIIGLTKNQIKMCDLVASTPINARASFGGTMHALYAASLGKIYVPGSVLLAKDLTEAISRIDGPFDPLRMSEIIRIARRFGSENLRLSWRYRAVFGCVSAVRVLRAARSVLRKDRENEERRQLLDRMVAGLKRGEKHLQRDPSSG